MVAGAFFGNARCSSRSREAVSRLKDDETILPANEVISSSLRTQPETHCCYSIIWRSRLWHFSDMEVPMTKHRRITGFVAVALFALAATTVNVRSHSHSTNLAIASAGMGSLKELTVDVSKLPIEEFDDQSLIFSSVTKR
jgi:hypothetical protein